MTEQPSTPTPGTHRWVSLMVHDLAASQHFYQALFGWEYQDGPQQLGPYVRALRHGRQVAGLGEIPAGGRRLVAWLPYVATEDADATAALIRDCGGTLAVGPLELERVGRLAIAADVCGAAFGLWQGGRGRRSPLHEAAGVPVWNELITVDSSLVSKFYTMVFGYEAVSRPVPAAGRDYLVLRLGQEPVAGVRGVGAELPHDRGPHWLTYFSVPEVSQALQRVGELGGRVLREPERSPSGRLAWAADPEGAPFGLVDHV